MEEFYSIDLDLVNMNFSQFIDLIDETSTLPISERNVSAYLEYTSLAEYFQVLEDDIIEPAFAANLLSREHLNIWLSDGNTLGRLHFDPYDNLLCQVNYNIIWCRTIHLS